MDITLKREAVEAAQRRMTFAHEAIGKAHNEAEAEHYRGEFETAKHDHESATRTLAQAEAIRSLPVVPFGDEEERGALGQASVVKEPLTYERDNVNVSFVRDAIAAQRGDNRAQERMARHEVEMVREGVVKERALSSTDGAGGDYIPPLWLAESLPLAKAGRPFADAVRHAPLPEGTDNINIPRVTGGATVGTQQDGGAVSSTDMTTGSYQAPVITIAGQQDLSMQAYERSSGTVAYDQVIYEELAARYAIALDLQLLTGSGSAGQAQGINGLSGTNTVTWTQATPAVGGPGGYYAKLAAAVQAIFTARIAPPSAIVVHPRRFAWLLSQSDTSNRPLILPADQSATNAVGLVSNVAPQNVVGQMLGLPVIADPNITTTNGAGSNEDITYVVRLEDIWLFEEEAPRFRVLSEVLSGNLQVRLQLWGYAAIASGRYPAAISRIVGTGAVTPTY